jgi:1A family penicillin-binding protein
MRTILYILFLLLALLLKIEDGIRVTLTFSKRLKAKIRKKYVNWKKLIQKKYQKILSSTLNQIKNAIGKFLIYSKRSIKTLSVLPRSNLKINRPRLPELNLKHRKKRGRPKIIPFQSKLKYLSIGIFFSFLCIFLPAIIYIFIQELPNPSELTLRQIPQTTKIFDRNGTLLTQIYAQQNRTIIPLSEIPTHLRHATFAIEDKNFYSHPGFDLSSIIRAIIVNLSGGKIQGGSTITQQLIKSSMLTPEKSFTRKFKEIVLAMWAERMYTKNQILEMYFNQIPYGGTAWGIEAASQTYFEKKTKDLTLAESAFLAGLTSAPSIYSPYSNDPTLWKKRQNEVLAKMIDLGYITQKQAKNARLEKLNFKKQQTAIHAPHFVTYIKELISQKYGLPMLEKGGLNITTSLDLKTQLIAEKIVKDEVQSNTHLNLSNGASIVTNPRNGDILAMIGSHDWNDPIGGNFNVTTSLRQPGSSIKVITYAAALQNGFTPASIIDDTPVTYINYTTPYSPVNYDGKFRGKVTLRTALANSLNIPAVKTLNQIGIPTMVNLAKKMGITTWDDPKNYGLSITLGAAEVTMLDMATVYATLANEGGRVDLNPILKITDSKGTLLEEKNPPQPIQVLEKGVAFIVSDILADNQTRQMAFGPNSPLNIPGHTVSVKTGTTDHKRDNWTAGYTQDYVVIVWVGNNNNDPMSPYLTSGITGAAPIWHNIMQSLLQSSPAIKPTPPPQIVQKDCAGRIEYLLKRTEDTPDCRSLKTYSQENNWFTPQRNRRINF